MKKEDLRIIFMGTPEFAAHSLKALVEGGYNIVAAVTQPDRPVGRHGTVLRAPAVKEYALSQGIPVLQPEKMKDPEFLSELKALKADLQVVVAFRMLPEVVWSMPPMGTFNVHAALLPQYRGAAPINWAVIGGETVTGVTTFFLDHDIDTGRIIRKKTFDIPDDADAAYVHDGLMVLGAEICLETIDDIIATDGNVPTTEQPDSEDGKPLKGAPKLFKETCQIDWNSPAKNVYDFIRGLSPYPAAWTPYATKNNADATLKVYKTAKTGEPADAAAGTIVIRDNRLLAATSNEWLELLEVQLSGKRRMASRDFINGMKN